MRTILILLAVCISASIYSQAPQGFSYQAALRNSDGHAMANQAVKLRISLTNEAQTTQYFVETHESNTNTQGVVNLVIGSGEFVSGSFSETPWGTAEIHLKVELQTANDNYLEMGTSRLMSVPYAQYAATGNQGPQGDQGVQGETGPQGEPGIPGIDGISIQWLGTHESNPIEPVVNQAYYNSIEKKSYVFNGTDWQIMSQDGLDAVSAVTGTGTAGKIAVWSGESTLSNLESFNVDPNVAVISYPTAGDEDPIFEVKNKQGQVVFGVYQSGVRIYVDDSNSKAEKGGFAVGGLSTGKEDGNLYFRVTPDSVRVLLRENTGKAEKGGFAVGGLSTGKGVKDLFFINPDSARIYINTDGTKAEKGGFAVGGLSTGKEAGQNLLFINSDSTRIYIDTDTSKAEKGGFAVGGLSTGKGTQEFMRITQDSTRIYIDDSPQRSAKGGFAVGGLSTSSKNGRANFFDIATDASGVVFPSQKRVLWYPIKNAFLVGKVLIESPDSVGENSFSTGYEAQAKGNYSQAMGFMSHSKGDYSTAIGHKALAKGINSFAVGDSAISEGSNSYAFGNLAYAQGDQSLAIGSWTKEGAYSSVIRTEALGTNSIAVGLGTKARGAYSISIGSTGIYTNPPTLMPIFNTNNANGDGSLVLGYGNTADSLGGILVGKANFSRAIGAMAFGYNNYALADYSYAFGHGNKTLGVNSTAIGHYTIAKDPKSTVVGTYNDTTLTNVQFAVGNGLRVMSSVTRRNAFTVFTNGDATISGNLIVATNSLGAGTIELGSGGTGNRNSYFDFHSDDTYTDYALRVIRYNSGVNAVSRIHHRGTGNFELYAQEAAPLLFFTNAAERMTITGSGRVAIGKTSPLYKFEVLDNSSGLFAAYIFKDYNSNSYGGLGIQAGATDGVGTNMMISVYNRNGAYKGGLAIVNNGNAQLVTSSDLKLKNNVKKTSIHGLDLIKRLNVVDFEYKDSPGIQQIGYIAQEVKEVFPSMVSFNEMENILQISTMSLIPVLNKAIQEQQTIIESQNEEIKLLRAEMEEIKRLIQK